MEPQDEPLYGQNQHSDAVDVEKSLPDSEKELLNLIAEIIVKIILEEEE